MSDLPRLTAAEAAARLGVKPESLYAYVSRGLLSRERDASGSSFDPLEVEAFARRRRRTPSAPPGTPQAGTPLMVLDTALAHIDDDELHYRERSATALAREQTFEAVVQWLWGIQSLRPPEPEDLAVARRTMSALGPAPSLDRLTVAVTALAATDPLRHDPAAGQLVRVGARLLTGLPAALLPAGDARGTIAETLWRALATTDRAAGVRLVDAALILVIDHDLAVSTLAARVAASARASGYAVVSAALGAFDSPLHGTASRAAVRLLQEVIGGEAAAVAIGRAVRDGGRGIPGFGQQLYTRGDMRARVLLEQLRGAPGGDAVMTAVDLVSREVGRRADLQPNLDLALAAITLWAGMPDDAGAVMFAVGRIAGWISHAIDEYDQRPMRLRPRGRYVGPAPE
ncbi:citrate synthase [Microbacterium sp. M3]|uniref:citrate synthase (unknown stereospecificity) n=1 Tax=Microbacterium arthrosphaerae TaxID=792652 RepID=A0ABU4H311_9MICO|nr:MULTISPECIES: citrate synthase [Microbacterium]MDW4573044.1 citrate synthase [Microbacterium arthrosphaerae]MDW7606899.1 citrate synthase [Microbacterium sp. M3]